MATTDFDIYLGAKDDLQGYMCSQLLPRDSAPLIAPRFSSGQQGDTDLDLVKANSIDNLAGGMFQRSWNDPQKVARALGIYNAADDNTYPTPPPVAINFSTPSVSTNADIGCKDESENYAFFTTQIFSAGTYYNTIVKIDKVAGTFTKLTLPAGLASNGFCFISSIKLHKGALFIASQTAGAAAGIWRYDIDANTFQDIGGSGGTMMFATMRGQLYAINRLSQIYSCTNEMAAGAATFTHLADIGFKDYNALPYSTEEFNGAQYTAKGDGIYRFDGVQAVQILPLVTKQLKRFNGALYFISGNWLYRFDGTNLTKLHQFGSLEPLGSTYTGSLSLSANSDYLFIQTSTVTGTYTQDDKPTTATALTRIYTYDGVGIMLLNESSPTLPVTYHQGLVYNGGKLYDLLATLSAGVWALTGQTISTATFFESSSVTTSSKLEITLSEFDGGYTSVFKSLEAIRCRYSGLITGDSLAVSYQTYDGKSWSAWNTAGTITPTSENKIDITDNTKKLFIAVRVSIIATLATGSTARIRGATIHSTLQPRARWRWNPAIIAEGVSTQDRNGNNLTTTANELNNQITKAIKSKTPLILLTPDYSKVGTGGNSAALTFTVQGKVPIYQDPYLEYPLCAVKNFSGVWEILRVSNASYAAGVTTITVLERGYMGITPATINSNAEFRCAHKVYVTRLVRDGVDLSPNTYDEQSTGESQLQRIFQLEVIEV